MKSIFIGLSGKIASGKTTTANYLKEKYGFKILRFRDIIIEVLKERGLEVNRENMQEMGNELYNILGSKLFSELLLCRVNDDYNYVIDSIRHEKIHIFFRKKLNWSYFFIFVDSNQDLRNIRLHTRDEKKFNLTSLESHTVESEIDTLKRYSDYVISNNEDEQNLHKQIDKIVDELIK